MFTLVRQTHIAGVPHQWPEGMFDMSSGE